MLQGFIVDKFCPGYSIDSGYHKVGMPFAMCSK